MGVFLFDPSRLVINYICIENKETQCAKHQRELLVNLNIHIFFLLFSLNDFNGQITSRLKLHSFLYTIYKYSNKIFA